MREKNPMTQAVDLAIVGAGSAGLIAADFALNLGARVALVERDRIGGDCTWTGCVPSKSLIKVATTAASVRRASQFGIRAAAPEVDFMQVRGYIRSRIEHIYRPTSPDVLRAKGLLVMCGATRFLDPHTLEVGGETLRARRMLLCTGAVPARPPLPGLDVTPYLTYKEVFEIDHLPSSLIVIGGGPLGCEMAQSFQRLGSQVTLIAPRLLPRAESEASALLSQVFAQDGVRHVPARAQAVRSDTGAVMVRTEQGELAGERLLVAVGRVPEVGGLELKRAGVQFDARGIRVDAKLRTTASHIYAAGDVLGGPQFSHLAGWQAFQAVRNALLPGSARGLPAVLPEVTFTVPEVGQVGLTEPQARERFGEDLRIASIDLQHVDRAVTEDDRLGFIKLIGHRDGRFLGATIMAERGGETIAEITLAMASGLTIGDLASAIHPYPTYSSAVQLLAAGLATQMTLSGIRGRLIRRLSRWSLGAH
jgi:pyruvate/2-oxoglutarate dehydrogenase complex dihydrolipoamide dehydrogenase (E3) component